MSSVQLSPDVERALERPANLRNATLRTFATSTTTASRNTIAKTKFTEMVFESVPFIYNILSCVFHWIILAGFLVLPTSFPNLQKLAENTGKIDNIFKDARNIPVMVIGLSCCAVGAIGLLILWLRWSHNYLWLLSSIFIPGMFSGLSGLISTFVNLYGAQNSCDGTTDAVHYGATTIATIATTGGCAAICGFLAMVYTIRKFYVIRRHHRENSLSQDGSVGSA